MNVLFIYNFVGVFLMIGFYNYSVILTYIGLGFSIIGITFAINDYFTLALICLLVSGFCDMFDGRIARTMKNRTELEKNFGIQIDSLCDLICFSVFPAIFGYCLGGNIILRTVSSIMIILAAVIRLGYFNVMEQKRQSETQEKMHRYTGLPVTSTALILPVAYLTKDRIGEQLFPIFFQCTLMVLSIMFLVKIRVKKPGLIGVLIMAIVGFAVGIDFILLHVRG